MRLVVFDVDGTLVNSQHEIADAMNQGLSGAGLPEMEPAEILAIVGLSLPVAVARLLPGASAQMHDRVVAGYREAFVAARAKGAVPPLYPGALDCLDALASLDHVLLGIATGKPMRGLTAVLEAHGLTGRFFTRQTADGHPSKPHPAMLQSALFDAGLEPDHAVMVGDTVFDIEMARAAGVAGYGVDWGYHPSADLLGAGAALVAPDYPTLTQALLDWAGKEQAA
ncbi:MAG TPA: HAD-IA family hydrolase [Paracoccus sp. (in: a-proteobacteria)]|uniref:HAD-IA family hydrolase n=1 Tax=Paracoccus sp. TaxID=267 RepID=UPI002CAA9BAE|nr:HAD-IA family hydrolase [Paracoccus sp. (in: a-proteobacteria)]HWL55757.1 HAD-IA family hydrolase [Paracoccus sp. (in: a-proteobacteria)]